jgi:multidrug efflux pump
VLSRFFIDRPIFATVLSVVITLAGGLAVFSLPTAQYPPISPPQVQVSISYPGASAQVVADTVAAPIEQQVNGVPGMLYMSSVSGNSGTYTLFVTFNVGTDLNTALVMVQNRVQQAMPLLPTSVQNQGITIRKKTPDILMMINLYSPDGRYDYLYLSNFAQIHLYDPLLRVDGVSDITILGLPYSMRAWLDPQELAARNVSAGDVATAVANQNLAAAPGQIGQPPSDARQAFDLPLDTLGRLTDPEQFGDIIVKVSNPAPAPHVTAKPPVFAGAAASRGPVGLSGFPVTTAGATTTNGATTGTTTTTAPGGTTTPSGMTTTGTTTAGIAGSTTNSGAPSGGAAAGGGATSPGGGTTSGGASTGGGATTGGAANSSLASAGANAGIPPTGMGIPGLSINAATATGAGATTTPGGGTLPGPQPPATAVVRLRDVARMELGAQNYNTGCTFDGRPSAGLAIFSLPGTNTLDLAQRVRARMEELKKRFPDGIDYAIAYDTTPFISESIDEVFRTLRDAVILVAIVVMLFLQDWRAMILPMIDVPVSLVGTFAVLAALGYSLNNISLFGLVLAIGIVVDDAIVVLENIERQMARGLDARTATLKAMEEITGPIIAITLVLCAVFVPCAFISGITGRFFRQFAVTIAASTIISATNAVTMTPSRALFVFKTEHAAGGHRHKKEALPWWIFAVVGGWLTASWGPRLLASPLGLPTPAATPAWLGWAQTAAWAAPGVLAGGVLGWLLIRPVNAGLGWLFGGFNRLFDGLTSAYGWTIGTALRLSLLVLVLYGSLLALTWWLFRGAPTGFVPAQDQGRVIAAVQLPDSASLWRTQETAALAERIARSVPGVAHTITVSGTSFVQQVYASNLATIFIVLDPFEKRRSPDLSADAIMARLRKAWRPQVKDGTVRVFGAPPVPGLSVAGGFMLMVEDRAGLGVENLQKRTDALIGKLKGQSGLTSVSTVFRSDTPELFLDIDRKKVASLGVSFDELDKTLSVYLGSLYVTNFNEFGRYWQVNLQAEGQFRSRVGNLNQLYVRNNQGLMVPLSTLATPREVGGPVFVQRYNLYTAAPITGGLLPGASSGQAIADIDATANETLPRSMGTEWTQLFFLQIREGNTTAVVFALAVLAVFLALSALYESWSLPLAVILVVPMCLLCAITGVLLAHLSVDIFVQIGLVVLVGLACKNAILIVEFARELTQQGKPRFEAAREASRLRLRPILITSFAFILGVFPLLTATGAGAEMRHSLGTAVFAGMFGVTLFGIFLTPVFFHVIGGLGETRLFTALPTRLIGSAVVGALLGAAAGLLLGRLGVVRGPWGPLVGAGVGALLVTGAMALHRRIRQRVSGA